jgi:5'-deoxynucleotidase YfbR-like HD superfamily hydrolase
MIEPWVQTNSGVPFDLLSPRVEDVRIADVAHHLSRIARYSGATLGNYGYTVAQHCCLTADLVRVWGGGPVLQREALLRDAGEAYYGDWVSPVSRALAELGAATVLHTLRNRVDDVVRKALSLEPTEPALVRRADLVALAIERRYLMSECTRDWDLPEFADTRWTSLEAIHPERAREAFLDRLEGLDREIEEARGQ